VAAVQLIDALEDVGVAVDLEVEPEGKTETGSEDGTDEQGDVEKKSTAEPVGMALDVADIQATLARLRDE
jgi:hypothetical protein